MSDSAIRRWSEKKARAKQEDSPKPEELAEGAVEDQSLPEEAQDAPPENIELPPVESLNEDSDYSVFMTPGVDEAVKKLALRKLFRLPQFGVLDGLNDYDEDFTYFEALGDIVTSDMKYHEERKKAEELKKKLESEEEIETLAKDEESTGETPADEEPATPADTPEVADNEQQTDDPQAS